jgi:hypothetical protein
MNKAAFDKKVESTLDDRAAGQEFSEALFDWLIRTVNYLPLKREACS